MQTIIERLSADELTAVYRWATEELITARSALIKLGRYHEPVDQTILMTDQHSIAYCAARAWQGLIIDEINVRMSHHGTRDPIKPIAKPMQKRSA